MTTASIANSEESQSSSVEQPQIGNFVLPPSQQPGSFISFGQSIFAKSKAQFSLFINDFQGSDNHYVSVIPAIFYGITDRFSIAATVPVAASYQYQQNNSSGLEDAIVQFEYAVYSANTFNYNDQATIVTNMTIPTGSSSSQPATGFGSPSFFLGTTFSRIYVEWLMFTSYGAVFPTSKNNTQFGNEYLYQAGIGRNIFDIGKEWIFAWIVEANGQYTQEDRINGAIDPNSGGNVVFITPSLWVSSKKLILQFGVGLPAVQHLFGNQRVTNYLLAFNLGWTI